MYPWDQSWRKKMVSKTVCHFVGSNLRGWDIFEKEGLAEKVCVEIEDWGTIAHFLLGFQENSIYTLHLRFS